MASDEVREIRPFQMVRPGESVLSIDKDLSFEIEKVDEEPSVPHPSEVTEPPAVELTDDEGVDPAALAAALAAEAAKEEEKKEEEVPKSEDEKKAPEDPFAPPAPSPKKSRSLKAEIDNSSQ